MNEETINQYTSEDNITDNPPESKKKFSLKKKLIIIILIIAVVIFAILNVLWFMHYSMFKKCVNEKFDKDKAEYQEDWIHYFYEDEDAENIPYYGVGAPTYLKFCGNLDFGETTYYNEIDGILVPEGDYQVSGMIFLHLFREYEYQIWITDLNDEEGMTYVIEVDENMNVLNEDELDEETRQIYEECKPKMEEMFQDVMGFFGKENITK